MMGGNEPSELKEEVKRGKSVGLNQQTGFWGVSAVWYRIWELTQLLWNTQIPHDRQKAKEDERFMVLVLFWDEYWTQRRRQNSKCWFRSESDSRRVSQ